MKASSEQTDAMYTSLSSQSRSELTRPFTKTGGPQIQPEPVTDYLLAAIENRTRVPQYVASRRRDFILHSLFLYIQSSYMGPNPIGYNNNIYLTAIGLSPGGSGFKHIYKYLTLCY